MSSDKAQTTQAVEDREARDAYYRDAASWSEDRDRARSASQRIAWLIAGTASIIALFEAVALTALMPLKTVVPYTLLVDRQTGFVQEIKPLDRQVLTPDAAITRSLLAQYVMAREGFDIDSLQDDYRKVALWSDGEARNRYVAGMRASNPTSPLAALPRRALVQVEIRSISSLGDDSALVRFVTVRTDPGGRASPAMPWASVVRYRFSAASMTAADRLANPLGFQVVRYRRDAEIPSSSPEPAAPAVQPPAALAPVKNGPISNETAPAVAPSGAFAP